MQNQSTKSQKTGKHRKKSDFLRCRTCFLFLSASENLTSEQQHVHCRKENDKDDQRQHRLRRRERCKEHHGESEHDRGEILIHHIVGCGGLEFTVHLAKQDDTRACRTHEYKAPLFSLQPPT